MHHRLRIGAFLGNAAVVDRLALFLIDIESELAQLMTSEFCQSAWLLARYFSATVAIVIWFCGELLCLK
jgi:hypothetical protein